MQDKRHLRNSLYMYIVKTTYAAPRKSDLDGRCKGWQKPAFLENLSSRETVSIVQAGSWPLASSGPVTTQAGSGQRSVNSGPEKEPHTGLWGPDCKSPLGAPLLSAQAGCSGNTATAESGKRGNPASPRSESLSTEQIPLSLSHLHGCGGEGGRGRGRGKEGAGERCTLASTNEPVPSPAYPP